ncbi:MAG TPA: Rrf2 family transcriptional regulator [Bacteroidales bacterium]|nr:Rrf2 family transcriptional regulator [Bacteroidales bacterium]
MISKTAKYAIRAVAYIGYVGRNQTIVSMKKIIEDLDIPTAFLKKILQELSKHKILNSFKGPKGGFTLSDKPQNISLFDIVTVIDGVDSYSSCILGRRDCNDHSIHQCFLHKEYFEIKAAWTRFLKKSTLEKIISDIEKEGGLSAI